MLQMLSFSPDGMWLLSAGREPDQAVAIWDVATAALLTSGHTSQPVKALAWRPTTALPSFITISKVTSLSLSESLSWTSLSVAINTCSEAANGGAHDLDFIKDW